MDTAVSYDLRIAFGLDAVHSGSAFHMPDYPFLEIAKMAFSFVCALAFSFVCTLILEYLRCF
jgi:hypothetical protein